MYSLCRTKERESSINNEKMLWFYMNSTVILKKNCTEKNKDKFIPAYMHGGSYFGGVKPISSRP